MNTMSGKNLKQRCREAEGEASSLRMSMAIIKAQLKELGKLDQERVDALHRALYPDGGPCNGYFDEIVEVAVLRAENHALKTTLDMAMMNLEVMDATMQAVAKQTVAKGA
jgi:hypothetical protein